MVIASRADLPVPASGPVSAMLKPIFSGSSAAAGKLNEATLSAASAASVAALMMCLDSVVIVVFSLVHVVIC
jgi:hypothetical protein